jgi:hypothetical protein
MHELHVTASLSGLSCADVQDDSLVSNQAMLAKEVDLLPLLNITMSEDILRITQYWAVDNMRSQIPSRCGSAANNQ